jgi:molybdopterin-guanine dinucleotide biosynthesis protein A
MGRCTIPAVILAGGRSTRMGGGDKALLQLGDRTLVEHVIGALTPQVGDILINTNSEPALFAHLNLPVLGDTVTGFQGPLAGILTGMLWAQQLDPGVSHIVVVPADVPFLPANLVARLLAALQPGNGDGAVALCAGRIQPTIGIWSVGLASRLARDLLETRTRKVQQWLGQLCFAEVEFPATDSSDFLNINRPKDLSMARFFSATRVHPTAPMGCRKAHA